MTTVAKFLQVALAEVGYVEGGGADGRSGNITKYWAEEEKGLQGQSWCAAFVSWVAKHSGHPLPAIDRPYGYISCADGVAYAKKNGLWDESGKYEPGDIIFFAWKGDGHADHTGIVLSDDGVTIETVEGNTSATDAGSQRNGGGVYKRDRKHGKTVLGVLKWSRVLKADAPAKVVVPDFGGGKGNSAPVSKPIPKPAPKPKHVGPWWYGRELRVEKPVLHGDDVKQVQRKVGVRVDGEYGPKTAHAVAMYQRSHHLTPDGVVGPATATHLG